MARKRKKRSARTGAIMWTLALASIAGGLLFSPITAVRHVRVLGAKPDDEARIVGELQTLKDKPCVRINAASIEDQILLRPDVKEADLSRNLLGNAVLTVAYYDPVARIAGTDGVVLTENGFLCRMPGAPPDLPMLNLFSGAISPNFGIGASWEPDAVADVCKRAQMQGIVKNLSISVTQNGSVCLNSGSTGRVSMGAPVELDEKFEQVKNILTEYPDLLAQKKDLVLIAPKKPVTRPLQGNPQ